MTSPIKTWAADKAKKPRSAAQIARQGDEHRSGGQYAKVNPCEMCGKSSGIKYFSPKFGDVDGKVQFCSACVEKLDAAKTKDEAVAILKGRAKKAPESKEKTDEQKKRVSKKQLAIVVGPANRASGTLKGYKNNSLQAVKDLIAESEKLLHTWSNVLIPEHIEEAKKDIAQAKSLLASKGSEVDANWKRYVESFKAQYGYEPKSF